MNKYKKMWYKMMQDAAEASEKDEDYCSAEKTWEKVLKKMMSIEAEVMMLDENLKKWEAD